MRVAKIEYSQRFIKDLKRAPQKIRLSFRARLEIFLSDNFHPLLNNHALGGKYQNYRSINITGDWRVVFKEDEDGSVVFFMALGTHSQLYR